MPCIHDWQLQNRFSPPGWAIRRYQCCLCKLWGYKDNPASKNIKAYKSESTDPDPKWWDAQKPEKWPENRSQPDATEDGPNTSRRRYSNR